MGDWGNAIKKSFYIVGAFTFLSYAAPIAYETFLPKEYKKEFKSTKNEIDKGVEKTKEFVDGFLEYIGIKK